MAWGNVYKRRIKVFTLALIIYLDYKALQQRGKWIKNKTKKAALWKKAHERNARRILNFMIQMEGLWVKLGQYLSTRADVLPEAYIQLLKQLQDSLPPRPLKEVCNTIEKEMGKSLEELFSKFVEVPLATASIAQVHRATLINGQEVVVKVQHDGIKRVILEDLKNAKSIVEWIAWAEPVYNFNPMIDEWCREAPKELDFNIEAENTQKVARNLGCDKSNSYTRGTNLVDVLIPEVIQSTEKVIILEYMDGVRLNDLDALQALGVDRKKLVEEITRAYAHQIYVDGLFNGDPHPGNFLVSKEYPHRPILLDFGLTKSLPMTTKQALAKMLLAAAEGDHVALLSAFAEMGLKLRMDLPEQAMEVTTVFFRSSTPASEASETLKNFTEERAKKMKDLQEKLKLDDKQAKRFNPVDAFPGDIVIFTRVLNLLRGLSATMDVRIVYFEIMRPFAESVLGGIINNGPATSTQWLCDTPVHSDVEGKLRMLLTDLGNAGKILGIQICAYKDGEVIIDTAAGVLGKYDPRPVQPDSLFPVFSVTKGITAGLLHWLVDNSKLRYDENISSIWPEFASNSKDMIKVHHVLNHTSGLHNALANIMKENPLLVSDWNECLQRIAESIPECEPGQLQLYHYLSFGWLCGGIVEHATGKKFQEILEEAFIRPLSIEGELYIGIPPGVEDRLAALTLDTDDLKKLSLLSARSDLPSTFQPSQIAQVATALPALFNSLFVRRAIIPAANGHCSARALARYYASLADCGAIPKLPSSAPPLGSHIHIPKFTSEKLHKKENSTRKKRLNVVSLCRTMMSENFNHEKRKKSVKTSSYDRVPSDEGSSTSSNLEENTYDVDMKRDDHKKTIVKIFSNFRIHDAFMGFGEYESFALPNGDFGLGFKRITSNDGSVIGFGHSGMGGSTGFCDVKNRFSIAITLNKMSFGAVTGKIIQLVCSELNLPMPRELKGLGDGEGSSEMISEMPLIN
ncbi:uncharacterized protein LOC130803845 isoform X2 [Amaranthus tricolor]|nr:uncharacterized protein LOC130803845 isoform X2 [Amaranthus tricolor]XP_057524029.1 uncharacterized protein LOC130803845 isoform X2 [Amaranthus tricolor]